MTLVRPITVLLLTGAALAPAVEPVVAGADDPFAALNLEAHGFASFGWLGSHGNDWLGDTSDGTTDFWEAAINAVARPVDRLRLGAQIFARDLGRYDNGRPTLDWAYADWRADDAFGVQVGRVKVPLGLYNEVLDVDAARTPVFLPPAVYAQRMRDLYISTDGGKIYGLVPAAGMGSVEYQFYAGAKSFSEEMGFASYLGELGLGDVISDISIDATLGGMLHWNTPWDGLALRLSLVDEHGFHAEGESSVTGWRTSYWIDDYYTGIASLLWESEGWTVAAEYSRTYARGGFRVEPLGLELPYADDGDAGYLSATWHFRPWLELYAAAEGSWADADDRGGKRLLTGVFAANLTPTRNWSLKAELRCNNGVNNLSPLDTAAGTDEHWQVLALKTTVDF